MIMIHLVSDGYRSCSKSKPPRRSFRASNAAACCCEKFFFVDNHWYFHSFSRSFPSLETHGRSLYRIWPQAPRVDCRASIR